MKVNATVCPAAMRGPLADDEGLALERHVAMFGDLRGLQAAMSPTFCAMTLTWPARIGSLCSTVSDPPEIGSE